MSLLGPCTLWTQIWEMVLSWRRTWKLEKALRWVFQVIEELWFSCSSIKHLSPTRCSACLLSNVNHPAEAQSGDDITCTWFLRVLFGFLGNRSDISVVQILQLPAAALTPIMLGSHNAGFYFSRLKEKRVVDRLSLGAEATVVVL